MAESLTHHYTEENWPASRWPNFGFNEMKCKETGECSLHPAFMDRLQMIRSEIGRSLSVTSGFRSQLHSVEKKKIDLGKPHGSHPRGVAADIAVAHGGEAYEILNAALSNQRFAGVGIRLKKDGSDFIHLDCAGYLCEFHVSRPAVWVYS